VQDVSLYDAGSIEGWVYIDAPTDIRFYVKAPFSKYGAAANYYISPSYVGDTPPAGYSMTITAAGLIQITLPSIASFTSAVINFALNAPAVGTNFPLNLDSANLTNSGITGLTGTAATTAFANGSLKVGEYQKVSPGSTVAFGAAGANTNITSITLAPGVYMLSGMVRIAISGGTATSYFSLLSSSSGAIDSLANVSGATGTITGNTYIPTVNRYVNVTTTSTYYLLGIINYSVVPTGNYATESFIQAIRIA
jgi:hypothetical protein